ncbi:MAG: M48 family metalloprotease [Nitrososphaeria archaeon]
MRCIDKSISEKLDDIAKKIGAEKGLSSGCRYYVGDYLWLARYDILKKRIIINEKYFNNLNEDEALAVLVHEEVHASQRIGYFLRALLAVIFATSIIFLITQAEFIILDFFYISSFAVLIITLALTLVDLILLLPYVVKLVSCALNLKHFEIEADTIAAKEVGKEQLISALMKANEMVMPVKNSVFAMLFKWWINVVDSCVHLQYERRLIYIREI